MSFVNPTLLSSTGVRSLQFLNSGLGFRAAAEYKKDNGVYVVEREPVFRSGVFRDSMGDQMTWEPLHMKQMLDNFTYLKSSGVFVNVPVRDGHPGWLINGLPGSGAVVGWHTGIDVATLASPIDAVEYDYILASYELTDPRAIQLKESGTYRNRSSEILRYYTNAEAEYWPVYGGFAFVDIPAVEGLNFARDVNAGNAVGSPSQTRYFVMSDTKEIQMTAPVPASPPVQPSAPQTSGQPAQPIAPAQAPTSQHVFTVNGKATTDYAAVQRHITVLESAATEARDAGRAAFVTGLVQRNLILGTEENVTRMTEFAQSLTDEQFEQWRVGYDGLQSPSLLSRHAAPAAGSANVGVTSGHLAPEADALSVAKEIVKYHRSNNMPLDKLKATKSYQQLVQAGVEQA